jgi:hypothetical protein
MSVEKETGSNESGTGFDLLNDSKIMEINTPIDRVTGPWAVVFKDLVERWVVVALSVDGQPRLGMRWFDIGAGTPFIRAKPIWFFVPQGLENAILQQLPIGCAFRQRIYDFLSGRIQGEKLKSNT